MEIYQEARIKVPNIQLNKIESTAQTKTRTTLKTAKENFQDEDLPHEKRNAFIPL